MAFVRACAASEVVDGAALRVEVDGLDVAIVRDVEGCEIECWMHGSRFDLRTGKPLGPPATESVPVFAVQIAGDDVLIDLDSTMGDN
jgi:3-phenylpropionate/trans-cinnamate dioxygenase ferredoxin subunit